MRKFKDVEVGGRFFDSPDYYATMYIKTPLIKDNFGFEFNAVCEAYVDEAHPNVKRRPMHMSALAIARIVLTLVKTAGLWGEASPLF